jgi:hypothetical protein
LTKLEISIDGGPWQSKPISTGSQNVGNGYSQRHSINVRVTDSEGQTRESGEKSAYSVPPPPPSVSVTYPQADVCLKDNSGTTVCEPGLRIRATNFPPGSQQVVRIRSASTGNNLSGISSKTVTMDGNGSWDSGDGWSNACGGGQAYVSVGSTNSATFQLSSC